MSSYSDLSNSGLNMKIERLKTSKNLQESIKRNDEIRRIQKQLKHQTLGASFSVIGGCRYQAIRNICKHFGLDKEGVEQ